MTDTSSKGTGILDYIMGMLFPYNGSIQSINIITAWTADSIGGRGRGQIFQDLLIEKSGEILFEEYDSAGYVYRKWQMEISGFRISRILNASERFASRSKTRRNGNSNCWEFHIEQEDGIEKTLGGSLLTSSQKQNEISRVVRACVPIDDLKLVDGGPLMAEPEDEYYD